MPPQDTVTRVVQVSYPQEVATVYVTQKTLLLTDVLSLPLRRFPRRVTTITQRVLAFEDDSDIHRSSTVLQAA